MQRLTRGAALAAAALTLSAASAGAAVTPGSVVPSQDPFYTAPSNIASYAAGAVVRSRSVTLNLQSANNAWQVAYRSNDSHGNAEMTTETIVVPKALSLLPRPAVSYEVPEDATGTQCEPSYQMANGANSGSDIDLNAMLQKGWASVIPDYEGPKSAWMAGPQAGHAVLDGIRAAKAFGAAGLLLSKWAIDGYSGGANGTGWAAQLEPTYAPDVKLAAVAMGGTPADPLAVANYIDGGAFSGFEAAAAWGINQDYPEMNIAAIENAQGVKDLAAVGGKCLPDILASFAFRTLASDTTIANPLAYPPVAAVLKIDTLGQSAPASAPIFDYHATPDEIVPVGQDDTLVKSWCSDGAKIQIARDAVAEHATEVLEEDGNVLSFLAARFAGTTAPTNNC
jgi:hypothetical protein